MKSLRKHIINRIIAREERTKKSRLVLNKIVQKSVVVILFFMACSSFSQSNKKKVLVVPYGRFEFVSKFSLEDIALQNQLNQAEVFNAYQKKMLTVFDRFPNDNFEFIAITDAQLNPYKKYIKYEDGKFDGRNYYAVKMKNFPLEAFTKLLADNDASFIVFINWYEIQKSSFTSRGKKRKRFKYSNHYVDYEVYNLFQQKIDAKGKYGLDLGTPTDEIAKYKGLRLTELEIAYQQVIIAIIEALNKPISE